MPQNGFSFFIFTAMAAVLYVALPASASNAPAATQDQEPEGIVISNRSHNDLVGVRFIQGKNVSLSRLDLAPGSDEELENPGGVAELRLDLGLSLCSWKNLALNGLHNITLCAEHENCLILTHTDGVPRHEIGNCTSLLPSQGATPVCTLNKFHPGMTMKDACGLVNTSNTTDDNAIITTLGYAGLVWNARLYAAGITDKGTDISRQLEDIELRQILNTDNLKAVRQTLDEQNYVPWQATFPGIEIDFTDMKDFGQSYGQGLLEQCIRMFLTRGRGEASIIYAPVDILPDLATADTPRHDVQIFTLLLRRDSDTLILDMSAYSGEEIRE